MHTPRLVGRDRSYTVHICGRDYLPSDGAKLGGGAGVHQPRTECSPFVAEAIQLVHLHRHRRHPRQILLRRAHRPRQRRLRVVAVQPLYGHPRERVEHVARVLHQRGEELGAGGRVLLPLAVDVGAVRVHPVDELPPALLDCAKRHRKAEVGAASLAHEHYLVKVQLGAAGMQPLGSGEAIVEAGREGVRAAQLASAVAKVYSNRHHSSPRQAAGQTRCM
mmetsp:Transcript_39156/g.85202  ORF Transcript_39156/g.85202 Transcript_39156/m.85202 type:complete len:220 (-) Transcript_39156:836-1495(-)